MELTNLPEGKHKKQWQVGEQTRGKKAGSGMEEAVETQCPAQAPVWHLPPWVGIWGALRVDRRGSNQAAMFAKGMFITEECLSSSHSEQ